MAVVGSAPSCLRNPPRLIDSHDIVVRINNFKTRGFERQVGSRTDVFYSFFGSSIRKTAAEIKSAGVKLCMAKCPNAQVIDSPWHTTHNRMRGVDYRYIYELRKKWWFCDTYIPTAERFLEQFALLGQHVPTTGFACLLDVLSFDCSVYVTGFDFFSSGKHNVNERWRAGNPADPIGHVPKLERQWLAQYAKKHSSRITLDKSLRDLLL